mmetsp:Transcript_3143/g.8021  ORF Transcript_3143/g.8021 Transcript_3143/m.8021 type:complete len:248 (-) Transcript_3143:40-783(-)
MAVPANQVGQQGSFSFLIIRSIMRSDRREDARNIPPRPDDPRGLAHETDGIVKFVDDVRADNEVQRRRRKRVPRRPSSHTWKSSLSLKLVPSDRNGCGLFDVISSAPGGFAFLAFSATSSPVPHATPPGGHSSRFAPTAGAFVMILSIVALGLVARCAMEPFASRKFTSATALETSTRTPRVAMQRIPHVALIFSSTWFRDRKNENVLRLLLSTLALRRLVSEIGFSSFDSNFISEHDAFASSDGAA